VTALSVDPFIRALTPVTRNFHIQILRGHKYSFHFRYDYNELQGIRGNQLIEGNFGYSEGRTLQHQGK
jgi:hypothetical protein